MLLSIWLIFCQFQPSAAYKSVAYKKASDTRNSKNIPRFKIKHNFFQNFFRIHNSESVDILEKSFLKFIRRSGWSVFNCFNFRGVKLLFGLRLGLSHLRKHKFKHGFQDSLNPICKCGNEIETSAHFLLHRRHQRLIQG